MKEKIDLIWDEYEDRFIAGVGNVRKNDLFSISKKEGESLLKQKLARLPKEKSKSAVDKTVKKEG